MALISMKMVCVSIDMPYEVLGTINNRIHVSNPSPIDKANKNSISYCMAKGEPALNIIRKSEAKVVICMCDIPITSADYQDKILILVSNPRLAFIRVMQKCFTEKVEYSIHSSATVHDRARLGKNVFIGPNSYIGECQIGNGTIIHGNVSIYRKVRIGRNVIIGAGTVIGSDGFSYERNDKGGLEKYPHIGGVRILDEVEIGTNVSIDKGTMGDTVIGKGTKIDNLCHIAHNVVIGNHCLIIAQSMIGGSVKIGDYSWIAPSVCIRDGIQIGNKVFIGMGSVVTKSVEDNRTVYGVPAKEINQH